MKPYQADLIDLALRPPTPLRISTKSIVSKQLSSLFCFNWCRVDHPHVKI